MSDKQSIGFIGYGTMASRMAAHLREAGHQILAFRPSQTTGSAPDGTPYLATARELAERTNILLVSVPNDDALTAAAEGPDGFLAGLSAGKLVINTSTVSPKAAEALARDGGARGVSVVDAPVSGSIPEAEGAQLVVLAGGSDADIARAEPILSLIGKKTIHAGPAGHGAKLKLVVNGIMGAGMVAMAEAFSYGVIAGLDRTMLLDALDGVAVLSPHHKRKLKAAAAGELSPQFPTRLMSKDMGLTLADGALNGVPMPTIAAAAQLLALTRRAHDDEDYSAVLPLVESLTTR